jgi:Fe-S-cluster containining protein
MKFPCTGCGQCCRQLGEILEAAATSGDESFVLLARVFPYTPRPDGSCPMLINNQCAVYAERPILCNLERLQRIMEIPDEVWFQLNAASCNKLIRDAGLSEELLVLGHARKAEDL